MKSYLIVPEPYGYLWEKFKEARGLSKSPECFSPFIEREPDPVKIVLPEAPESKKITVFIPARRCGKTAMERSVVL